MVFGLDHMVTEQEASPEEIEAIKKFLKREGTCLILSPHHDVGFSEDLNQRQQEYKHHGDPLVPRQQRFGKYTRSLMKGLGVPVENGLVYVRQLLQEQKINWYLSSNKWILINVVG